MTLNITKGQVYFDKKMDESYENLYIQESTDPELAGIKTTRVYGVLKIGNQYKVDGVDMVDTTFGEVDLATLEQSIREGKLIPLDAREQEGKRPSNYDALIAEHTIPAAAPAMQREGLQAGREVIYIASPLRGDVEVNVKNAMRYCAQAVQEGFIPIAPHAMYRGMFNDEIPEQRAAALEIGLALLQKCSRVWVCGDRTSAGMQGEIDNAKRMGLLIEQKSERYFQLAPLRPKLTFRRLRDAVARSMAYLSTPDRIGELFTIKATHRRFGLSNALAIYRQRPNATYTATYHEWHKLGYQVNDMRSIKVWTPIQSARFLRDGMPTDTREATSAERGAIASGKLSVTPHTTYRMNFVYDITQTNCPVSEYAAVAGDPLTAATHTDRYAAMKLFTEKCGMKVNESDDTTTMYVKGYYHNEEIVISSRIRDPQKLSALCSAFAEGFVEQTSTQPPDARRFESRALFSLLQARMGLAASEVDSSTLLVSFLGASQDGKLSVEACFSHVSRAENYIVKGLTKEIVGLSGEATAQKEMGLSQKQINQNL